jgi:acyl dehydratase
MHGMWTKARCLAQLQEQLPDAFSVDVEFKLPVFLPTTLSYFQEPVANGWVFDVCSEEGEKSHLIGSIKTVKTKK